MNHYLPSAFDYKDFNSKIITGLNIYRKVLSAGDTKSITCCCCCCLVFLSSAIYVLATDAGLHFCPHSSAPGPNYDLTFGALTRPLTKELLWPASFRNCAFEWKAERRAPFTNLWVVSAIWFHVCPTPPLVLQMWGNTALRGLASHVKPVQKRTETQTAQVFTGTSLSDRGTTWQQIQRWAWGAPPDTTGDWFSISKFISFSLIFICILFPTV